MQSECDGKTIYKITPCKPPGNCMDYEDYDPCESSDDITEKDLAVLLREEKLRLQELELAKASTEASTEATKAKEAQKDKNAFTSAGYDDKFSKAKEKSSNNEMTAEEQAGKKKICKKLIKNPFFSNRLKFSASDLPPPPPSPPPQFFPPVEDTDSKDVLNCQKRKKKCKKSDDDKEKEKGKEKGKDKDKDKKDQGADDDPKLEDQDGAEELFGDKEDYGENDGGKNDDGNYRKYERDDGWKTYDDGKKKKCRKTSDRPPCRKKVSEESITFQPRQIPAAQKDLPLTSPSDCPDMIRQIKMAFEHSCTMECSKKKCKKKSYTE